MLREDADSAAPDDRVAIENIGGDTLDLGALTQKKLFPSGKRRASTASKFNQRGGADLAFHSLAFVQHRKSEHHLSAVITHSFVPHERHRIPHPQAKKKCLIFGDLSKGGPFR
jgi:hypothetical protein